jgi:hypothetical protein
MFVYMLDGVERHFQQYFSYFVAISFIGGGNRRIRRKPPTCRKSLTNLITKCYTPRPDGDSKRRGTKGTNNNLQNPTKNRG